MCEIDNFLGIFTIKTIKITKFLKKNAIKFYITVSFPIMGSYILNNIFYKNEFFKD